MWPRSEITPITPPEPKHKHKCRRATLRRKEADEIKNGIRNGKVTKKGAIITCTICGVNGHNRRYHGKSTQESARSTQTSKLPVSDLLVLLFIL